MDFFDIGDKVELVAIAKKRSDQSPANPGDYYFKVLPPSGTAVKPAASAGDGDGECKAFYEPTEEGPHRFLFLAKSGDKTAGEGRFQVREPKVPRD